MIEYIVTQVVNLHEDTPTSGVNKLLVGTLNHLRYFNLSCVISCEYSHWVLWWTTVDPLYSRCYDKLSSSDKLKLRGIHS